MPPRGPTDVPPGGGPLLHVHEEGLHVSLGAAPLNIGALAASVVHPSAGGVALFVGTTRDCFEGRAVLRLEYEAYEAMALKVGAGRVRGRGGLVR